MTTINDEMRTLLTQMHEKNRLKREVGSLEAQKNALDEKLRKLESILRREQQDVSALQRPTLSSLWLKICGTHEETLRREEADVEAARLKFAIAQDEMNGIEKEIAHRRKMLSDYSLCEHRYQELMQQKRAELLSSAAGENIRRMEEEAAQLRAQQKEIKEAIDVGGSALHTAEDILACLKTAGGFATWDLLGGGMLADLAKHSEMNSAQVLIERLQHQLRSFKTELGDVNANIDLPGFDFLSFADYFFDGLIADWMMKNRISKAQEQVQTTRQQISLALKCLREEESKTRKQLESLQSKIENAIQEA